VSPSHSAIRRQAQLSAAESCATLIWRNSSLSPPCLFYIAGLGLAQAGEGLHIEKARQKLAFLPEFDGLGVPNRTDTLAWLRHYFAFSYVAENGTEAVRDREWGEIPSSPQHVRTATTLRVLGKSSADPLLKRSLVVALVGDAWSPDK